MKKIKEQKPASKHVHRKFSDYVSDDYKTPVFMPFDIEFMSEYFSNDSVRKMNKKYCRKSESDKSNNQNK